ncbi:hypothetical protein GGR53DRAFT_468258 [Hypoxylon sp. FL1150]|nr:hypothetical protein GGR53DRAFT_468258 [Hypoxylon sp. FL1150]
MPRQRVPITFTYQKNGTYPPIYVAGSFSDPPWQPQEMDVSIDQHGGHLFTKTVMVKGGSEIQYKFRIGLGDWWALDDNADTITDNLGNVNSVLRVSINKSQGIDTESPTPKVAESQEPTPSSDTQAHDIAEIAAEVADSACAIDPEAPEPEISDAEAGRIGMRRMSHTPISQVAQTAMEVAIVAATLDIDDSESGDELDDESNSCPIFSYEFMGPPSKGEETSDQSASMTITQDDDPSPETEDPDFDNPQLEKLPSSDRHSIIVAVRRISSSIEADRTVIDGIPPSSVVPLFRQCGVVGTNEEPKGSSEPIGTPSREESTDPPSLTTDQSDSAYSRTSQASISSLDSIAEGDELPNENISREPNDIDVTTPYTQHPGPSWGSVFEHTVGSDSDDEAIAMRTESKRKGEELQDRSPTSTSNPVTSPSDEIAEPSPRESAVIKEEVSASADDKDAQMIESTSKDSPRSTACRPPGTYESDSSNRESSNEGEGEGEGEAQLAPTKPKSEADLQRHTTDRKAVSSHTHISQGANKYIGWLESCFLVVLVKWFGGFAAWLYHRRPRTLMAAGTAAVVVGVGVLWENLIRI